MANEKNSTPERWSGVPLADIVDPDKLFLPREECLAGNESEDQEKAKNYPFPGADVSKESNIQPSKVKGSIWNRDRSKDGERNPEDRTEKDYKKPVESGDLSFLKENTPFQEGWEDELDAEEATSKQAHDIAHEYRSEIDGLSTFDDLDKPEPTFDFGTDTGIPEFLKEKVENTASHIREAREDVAQFFAENPSLDPKAKGVYAKYKAWAEKKGLTPVYQPTFSRKAQMLATAKAAAPQEPETPKVYSRGAQEVMKDLGDLGGDYVEETFRNVEDIAGKIARRDSLAPHHGFIYGSGGIGKGSANSSLINTPEGRKPMGNLKVGDYITTPKGRAAKILEVHPLGLQQIFQVSLSDGACAYVTEDHLWKVKRMDAVISRAKRKYGEILPRRWDLLTTKQMMEIGLTYKNRNGGWKFAIPYMETPYEKKNAATKDQMPMDPYILGLLLGDGGLSVKNGVGFSSHDDFIIQELKTRLSAVGCSLSPTSKNAGDYLITGDENNYGKKNSIDLSLKNLNLKSIKSFDKFIPKVYLEADKETRLDLLQGLMDTDGSLINSPCRNKKSQHWVAQFYTVSPQLKDDVVELVRSLGGKVSVNKKPSRYKDSDGNIVVCQDHYRLSICFISPDINPFKLPRKAEKYKPAKAETRTIRSIEPVYKEEATCILIDDPEHLYVADDYVVTHNTYTVVKTVEEICDSSPDLEKWKILKGSTTGAALYTLLWKYRDGWVIIFDDNDGVLGDRNAVNYLKAAMDPDQPRIVSKSTMKSLGEEYDDNSSLKKYLKEASGLFEARATEEEEDEDFFDEDDVEIDEPSDLRTADEIAEKERLLLKRQKELRDERTNYWIDHVDPEIDPASELYSDAEGAPSKKVPPEFQFASRIIFISNLPNLPQPIADRVEPGEVKLDKHQILDRVEMIMDNLVDKEPKLLALPNKGRKLKEEVLAYLRKVVDAEAEGIKDETGNSFVINAPFTFRLFAKCVSYRVLYPGIWKRRVIKALREKSAGGVK